MTESTWFAAGHVSPLHIHEHDDEGFFVLEGELTVYAEPGPTVLRPGQAAHVPAGTSHTFAVTSAGPAHVVLVSARAGLVERLRAHGRPAERDAGPFPPVSSRRGRRARLRDDHAGSPPSSGRVAEEGFRTS
jgi:hypothetical protein